MIRPSVLANAVATVVAAGYVLCRLIGALAPGSCSMLGRAGSTR